MVEDKSARPAWCHQLTTASSPPPSHCRATQHGQFALGTTCCGWLEGELTGRVSEWVGRAQLSDGDDQGLPIFTHTSCHCHCHQSELWAIQSLGCLSVVAIFRPVLCWWEARQVAEMWQQLGTSHFHTPSAAKQPEHHCH